MLELEHAWNRATSPMCPLCNQCVETREHIFKCKVPHAKANRLTQLEQLDKEMRKIDTHPIRRRQVMRVIRQYCSDFPIK